MKKKIFITVNTRDLALQTFNSVAKLAEAAGLSRQAVYKALKRGGQVGTFHLFGTVDEASEFKKKRLRLARDPDMDIDRIIATLENVAEDLKKMDDVLPDLLAYRVAMEQVSHLGRVMLADVIEREKKDRKRAEDEQMMLEDEQIDTEEVQKGIGIEDMEPEMVKFLYGNIPPA